MYELLNKLQYKTNIQPIKTKKLHYQILEGKTL